MNDDGYGDRGDEEEEDIVHWEERECGLDDEGYGEQR